MEIRDDDPQVQESLNLDNAAVCYLCLAGLSLGLGLYLITQAKIFAGLSLMVISILCGIAAHRCDEKSREILDKMREGK